MAQYQADEKTARLTTVNNFRDVADFCPTLKRGLLFRSGNIDDASPEECTILREKHRICSIVDLRGMRPWPCINSPSTSNDSCSHTVQYPDMIAQTSILGLSQHYISLAGPQYNEHQFQKLSWFEKTKSVVRMMISQEDGVERYKKLITSKAVQDRMSFAREVIDLSHPQVKALFKVLANPSSYPLLIMDTWGLGLCSLAICLILLLLEVDKQSILCDYMRTYQELSPFREKISQEIRKAGLPDDWNNPMPYYVDAIEQHLQTKHGGIENYLLSLGLSQSELQSIQSTLRSSAKPSEKSGFLIGV